MKLIPQSEPQIGQEEKKAMVEYLDSGGWLTEHKKTREFEQRIADYVGSKYAVVTTSGTTALFLAITALGIKGKVIVPDFTMIATANAVLLAGAEPVFVDIDSSNLCLDLYSVLGIREYKDIQAVVLVHLNGRCPKMEDYVQFCKAYNLYLIEDACQALGSRHGNKYLGTFGDVGVFSFDSHKIITTGQGGAVVTDNKDTYEKLVRLKDYGRLQGGKDYHPEMGYNFKFTDLQATIGIEQLKKIEQKIKRKKEIYQLYHDLLNVEFIETNLEETVPWFVDIILEDRDRIAGFLKDKGIGTRPFYPPIHTQPPYKTNEKFMVSEMLSKRGLWLPSSLTLTNQDIEEICEHILKDGK